MLKANFVSADGLGIHKLAQKVLVYLKEIELVRNLSILETNFESADVLGSRKRENSLLLSCDFSWIWHCRHIHFFLWLANAVRW